MSAFLETGEFFITWIGFLFLMTLVLAAALFWGVRTRQFANQDRARYLPLLSGIPAGEPGEREKQP